MTLEVWLSFAIFAGAAIATPGPGNLNTLRRAVELGRRPALFCMLGNVAGLAILGAVTGLGIVAVLATSPDIWFAFQWLAIGFLIFLSIQMMIKNRPPSGASQPGPPTMAFRLFGESFVVSLLNPKAAVFFLAVFPLFVDPKLSPAKQSALIVLTCMTISAISHILYIALAGWARPFLSDQNHYRNFRVLSGLTMMGIAFGLVLKLEPP